MRHLALFLASAVSLISAPAFAQPNFSMTFTPDTIGPGSSTRLVFLIDNTTGGATTDLTFTHVLAFARLADASDATTDCPDAVLSAPNQGTVVAMSGARLGAGGVCTVEVNVWSDTLGTLNNTT